MPKFSTFVKTTQGLNLDNKLATSGEVLDLTSMAVGSGIWPGGTDPSTLTALQAETMRVAVGEPVPRGDGSYEVHGVLSNVGLATGFDWQECGVFAQDPDLGEILYMVTHVEDSSQADYIPADGGNNLVELDFAFIIQSAAGVEVTAVLDDTLVLATKRDVENHARFARLTALTGGGSGALDAIPWGECVDNELAVVEMGGGLLAFYRFDKDSTAAESAPSCIKPDNAGANPGRWLQRGTVGESDLWDALNAHEARTDNPHGVTKAQVGLGNLPNAKSDSVTLASTTTLATSLAVKTVKDAQAATQAELDTHEARTNNPHGVTAAQVGAAPASHSHGGTDVTAASTSARGTIEIATHSEALGGTDTSRAVTSAGLASSKSYAANGYQKLPGGLILQWGKFSSSEDGEISLSWPISFPVAIYCAQLMRLQAGQDAVVNMASVSLSGFTVDRPNNIDGGWTYYFFAIGR